MATLLPILDNNAPESLLEALKAYLRAKDPTEYFFAKEYFGSWAKWELFSELPENKEMIEGWRKELTLKLRAEALARIIEAAQGETRDALAANKYLFEVLNPVKIDKGNGVGRPSKELINKEAHKLTEDNRLREEAFNRLIKES